jgi:type IV pilus assembly protein PilM
VSKNQIGIDIGSTAVRAVAVSGTDAAGMPQVSAVSIVPLPPGALVAGRIEHPDIVADAVKTALKQGKMSRYGAVLGISVPKVGISTVKMPAALRPDEWPTVMRLGANEVSTVVKLHEAYLGFSRVPTDETAGVSDTVVLSATVIRQEDVDALLEVCRKAKIVPRAIDLSAAATFRGLTAMPAGDHSSVSTVVDVGATSVTISTRVGRRLRSVRVVDEGSANITLALQGALDLSSDDAEERKKSIHVGPLEAANKPRSIASQVLASAYASDDDEVKVQEDPAVVANRAATTATDALIEKIASAVDSDLVDNPGQPTTSVTLCGRGALLHGLTQRVQARLGVPTFVRRPYMNVLDNSRTKAVYNEGTLDPARTLELVTATGLALWKGER